MVIDGIGSYMQIPMGHMPPRYSQGVHILMNRLTGKTLSECFIEFATVADAQTALEHQGTHRIIKGREVSLLPSTQKEFMAALFVGFSLPELSSDNPFLMARNNAVSPPASQATARLGSSTVFLTRDEIQPILTISKNNMLIILIPSEALIYTTPSCTFLASVPNVRLNSSLRFCPKSLGSLTTVSVSCSAIISLKCSRVMLFIFYVPKKLTKWSSCS
jgi:hypothetical protein